MRAGDLNNLTRQLCNFRRREWRKLYDRERRARAREIREGRDEEHLALIRQCPCLLCEASPARTPIHAHHLRCLGRKGLGQKVSDYHTVPLCWHHHDEIHRVGGKRELEAFAAYGYRDVRGVAVALKAASPNWSQMSSIVLVNKLQASWALLERKRA
jgi:hypothetical protein